MNRLEKALFEALKTQGLTVAEIEELNFYRNLHPSSLLYSALTERSRELIASFMPYSKAQLSQDLFALAISNTKDPKFFVEFGATDGISLSNTWLLEKKLGWSGILAEPAKTWHKSLAQNRGCTIDTRCVARESNQLCSFLEVNHSDKREFNAELSGLKEYSNRGDWASDIRLSESKEYLVETISLEDLMDSHNAPEEIQFLSIDTEGSEFEIIKNFDFKKRKIYSICIEHNYVNSTRQQINELLRNNGYYQVLRQLSKFDDWYILKNT